MIRKDYHLSYKQFIFTELSEHAAYTAKRTSVGDASFT